jgi:hypothetical protein
MCLSSTSTGNANSATPWAAMVGATMEITADVLANIGQYTAAKVPYRSARCNNDLGIRTDDARAEARALSPGFT